MQQVTTENNNSKMLFDKCWNMSISPLFAETSADQMQSRHDHVDKFDPDKG
jgi:hypothetical protein